MEQKILPKNEKPKSPDQIINFLEKETYRGKAKGLWQKWKQFRANSLFENKYFRFVIDPNKTALTGEHLQFFASLPIEISITEKLGKLVFVTGKSKSAGYGDYKMLRARRSEVSLHSHPVNEDGTLWDIPSLTDIFSAENTGTPKMLLTAKGISVYYLSQSDFPASDVASLLTQNGIPTIVKGRDIKFLKLISKVEVGKATKLCDDYLERKKHFVIKKSSWEDKEAIAEILRVINLQERIALPEEEIDPDDE